MKIALTLTLLAGSFCFSESKPCVVVRIHQKKASEAITRWTVPKPFDYVEGEYPKGMKFQHEIGDKTVRQIQQAGGKVVIMKPDYALADLEDARQQCKAFQADH